MIERSTRYSIEDGELYAIVLKLMGNNICEVLCIDGETRTCVIRKKFSGKGKRDNLLSRGKWILIGLREWQITNKEKEKCDLLEVYTDFNKEMIIKNSRYDFRPFLTLMQEEGCIDMDSIQFINERESNIKYENNSLNELKKMDSNVVYSNLINSSDEDDNDVIDDGKDLEKVEDGDESIELGELKKFGDVNKDVAEMISGMDLIDPNDI